MVQFKQKCFRCKKNYVIATSRSAYNTVCFECQEKDMIGEITDPVMKEMFDIPEEFYKNSSFLRSIKINHLRYGQLSEKQIEVFKSAVAKMKGEQANPEKKEKKIENIPEPEPQLSMRAERLQKKAIKEAKQAKK